MPIVELATFDIIPPWTYYFPTFEKFLGTVTSRQSACSGYAVFWCLDEMDPGIVHLLSGWDGVEAHMKWIESEANQELLALSGPYLRLKAMVHLDIDFTPIAKSMAQSGHPIFCTKYRKKKVDDGEDDDVAHRRYPWRCWDVRGDILDEKQPGIAYQLCSCGCGFDCVTSPGTGRFGTCPKTAVLLDLGIVGEVEQKTDESKGRDDDVEGGVKARDGQGGRGGEGFASLWRNTAKKVLGNIGPMSRRLTRRSRKDTV